MILVFIYYRNPFFVTFCDCVLFMKVHMYSRYLTTDEMSHYTDYCEDICWNLTSNWTVVNPGMVQFQPIRMYRNIVSTFLLYTCVYWLVSIFSQGALTMFVGVINTCAVLITECHNSHKHSQNPLTNLHYVTKKCHLYVFGVVHS